MTVKRMDNVGIVVEDVDAAIAFFTALGLELEESRDVVKHGRPFQVMRSEPAPGRVGSSAYRALRDRLTVTLSELSRGRARPP